MKSIYKNEQIKKDYLNLLTKIAGGYLYGEPIEPDDMVSIAVAAYFIGLEEGMGYKQGEN